jgi:hypothetical protein
LVTEERFLSIHPGKFWNKVKKSEDPDGCWLWQGSVNPGGYGLIYAYDPETGKNGKPILAHRYSFWLHNGYITEGYVVMHSCDVRRCVREIHISEGTTADNNRDKEEKGRGGQLRYEAHNLALLTWTQIRELRARYATGSYSSVQLGNIYNVDNTTAHKIARNELWYDPDYIVPQIDTRQFNVQKLDWDTVRKIRLEAATGIKNGQLAKKYGISAAMVTALVANTRWTDPEYTPPAPRSVSERYAKLTPNQVQEIRARHAAGARIIDLATEFKVNDANIIAIVKRKSWKDVA